MVHIDNAQNVLFLPHKDVRDKWKHFLELLPNFNAILIYMFW